MMAIRYVYESDRCDLRKWMCRMYTNRIAKIPRYEYLIKPMAHESILPDIERRLQTCSTTFDWKILNVIELSILLVIQ